MVVFLGIFFDIIGVAVTVANEEEFHAKATKKVKGSKDSIKLIKNAPKVANICADVIGDICGVLSGSISALISIKISTQMNLPFNIQFVLSALVSAFTVSGKAFGKDIANKKSTEIVHKVGIVLNKKVGDYVRKGEPLAYIHSNKEDISLESKCVFDAYKLGKDKIEPKLILKVVK